MTHFQSLDDSITQSHNLLMNGVIIVDKPASWTSHDVVNRMRRILGQRSVGHLGTLDPLATGVLPLVFGSLTRLAQFYTASEKTYEGVIRFGFATTTYDADGDPVVPGSSSSQPEQIFSAGERPQSQATPVHGPLLDLSELQQLAGEFLGITQQTPPPFSAKKIHGVPAYKLARQHKEVELKPVQVEIKEFAITSVDAGHARFRARVSSGTYMRSIAHDLGQRLGCGAHLASLRRTAVAEFDIAQAHTIEAIENFANQKQAQPYLPPNLCHSEQVRANASARRRIPTESRLTQSPPIEENPVEENSSAGSQSRREPASIQSLFIHPRQLLPQFPSVTADEPTAAGIRNGRPVNLPELSRARHVKVFTNQTDLIAIATRVAGSLFHPKIVFPAE